ncbi:MAG: bifunctional 2-keto-4-hydroxyglutarate aldolase/2-keto-3-deoxy-6-phosphogluconate aldolase [Clostridia bacterium]|nr:bifunctional 2-keto-4-hydroxyglutarate aldolase/2-keto-3-deoxy-6-phosphogluconate aldolase [Clostridia bacterium]
MEKERIISRIKEGGLVAVVRAENAEKAISITEACIEGGVAAIELTFTVPFAHQVIETLAKRYDKGEIIIGAGTVLDGETARIAMLSGARFIVSPCFKEDIVRLCNRYRTPVMPGVMTVTEAVAAMEAGADVLKVFPGELLGPSFIKALRGPLPYAQIMPTGGVSEENAAEWIKAGAVALGVGGALTKGTPEEIKARAERFIKIIGEARK